MLQCMCRLINFVNKSSHCNLRSISHQPPRFSGAKTYEGDGKTSIHILNNETDLGLMINGFSQVGESAVFKHEDEVLEDAFATSVGYYFLYFAIGFRLNNGMTVLGPMAIFPRSVLSWNVGEASDINEESLSLFTILEPKLDILILGIGDKPEEFSIYQKLIPLSQKLKLSVEILSTEQACATFNFLNSESRMVAAALIPPQTVKASEDDIMKSKLRYQNLYETEDPKLI